MLASEAQAQSVPPAPPTNLTALDRPWDNGTRVDLSWSPSSDDAVIQGYIVRKRALQEQEFTRVDMVPAGTTTFTVDALSPEQSYHFQLSALGQDNTESSSITTNTPVMPTIEWFDGTRVWFLLLLIVFSAAVLSFIALARRGKPMKVRQISGLKAIDEAVGRATEMGRPCLFIPGILDMNDIQTIAGINILARVAKTAAEYDARIEIPTSRSLVMTASRETVETAFLAAGRPDAFSPDAIYYVTDEQFGFVAYVQGMMVREKPAACFYMGAFFAESLILAETGNRVGAIQVAGTAQITQLPFFVAACDYTLIGEEFFAASAYLSGEPDQLGSLKGQDVGKLIVAAGIIVGVVGITYASITGSTEVQSMVNFFTQTILN
jgi:hypothetical protein